MTVVSLGQLGKAKVNIALITLNTYIFYRSRSYNEQYFYTEQGRRHELLSGGTDSDPQTYLPQILFLLGFRPLYFEILGKKIFLQFK